MFRGVFATGVLWIVLVLSGLYLLTADISKRPANLQEEIATQTQSHGYCVAKRESGNLVVDCLVVPFFNTAQDRPQQQPDHQTWVALTVALLAILFFIVVCARIVAWLFENTTAGRNLREKLNKAQAWVILRTVAYVSGLLVVVFAHKLQHVALVVSLFTHLLYRLLLIRWQQTSTADDVMFFGSYVIACDMASRIFGSAFITFFAIAGFYCMTIVFNTAGVEPVSSSRHRYWTLVRTLAPINVFSVLFLFSMSPAMVQLYGDTIPLLVWVPMALASLLMGHVRFKHTILPYWASQVFILAGIFIAYAVCKHQQWLPYHELLLCLFILAKLVDVSAQWDLEWLDATVLYALVCIFLWWLHY